MKKLFFGLTIILSFGLVACGNDDSIAEEVVEDTTEIESTAPTETNDVQSWDEQIKEIATNEDAASDKFYALESLLLSEEPTLEEVEQFKVDIIEDYKSGSYLSELDNHERMLTNIFKSYFVEKNMDGAIKEFAFDYHQNLKYAYRGVDSPDSDAVKANEEQMNKSLSEIQ